MHLSHSSLPINCQSEQVFDFISDFRNFSRLIHTHVQEYEAGNDWCEFVLAGLGKVRIDLVQQVRPTFIKARSSYPNSFEAELVVNLKGLPGDQTQSQVEFYSDLSPMMALFAKPLLQELIEQLNSRLKNTCESS